MPGIKYLTRKYPIALFIICHFCLTNKGHGQSNYLNYHSNVIECEALIVDRNYTAAIRAYDTLFKQFDFLFLRDIKVATELCVFQKDYQSAISFIRLGIQAGWTLDAIKKRKNLKPVQTYPGWKNLESIYDTLHKVYYSRLNIPLKEEIHKMFKKDQKKALGALFRIGQKAKRRYAEKKFAPHSEQQLKMLTKILDKYGYPGERLIGNNVWASVILSHHNSISIPYNSKDTLYHQIKPKLLIALTQGTISPYELAQIEDWRIAALNDHRLTAYGFLGTIADNATLEIIDQNRAAIGLRSIDLRNNLIHIEKETGMNLYLPKGWQNGEITTAHEQ